MPQKKPFDEQLMGIFNPLLLFCLFFFFPLIVLVLLFKINPGTKFFPNLIFYMGISYICGGFIFFGTKMWELWDNKFVLFKRARWKSDPILRTVYYKVVVPPNFDRSLEDMYFYFGDMGNIINGKRTKFDMYNFGKWYYDWNFDVIVRKGKPEMYMSFPYKRLDFVMKVLKSHYSEIKLIETTDPYEKWPKDWIPGKTKLGPYTDFHAWDYKLFNSGLYPLGDSTKMSNNPLGSLLDTFCKFDPDTMFVLQYVFRSFPNVKFDEWNQELEGFRKNLLINNASFEVTDSKGEVKIGAQGDLMSERNKRIIEACENKLSDYHYRTHVRLLIFYPKNKGYYGKIIEKIAKVYFGGIGGDKNFLLKASETSTDRSFSESKWPILDGIIGPLMNRFYFFKERIYRGKLQYAGMLDRDPDVAWDSMDMLIDAKSMAAMFHWPKLPDGIFMDEWEKIQKDVIKPRTIDVQTAQAFSSKNLKLETQDKISEIDEGLITGSHLTSLDFDKSTVEHSTQKPPQEITLEIKDNLNKNQEPKITSQSVKIKEGEKISINLDQNLTTQTNQTATTSTKPAQVFFDNQPNQTASSDLNTQKISPFEKPKTASNPNFANSLNSFTPDFADDKNQNPNFANKLTNLKNNNHKKISIPYLNSEHNFKQNQELKDLDTQNLSELEKALFYDKQELNKHFKMPSYGQIEDNED